MSIALRSDDNVQDGRLKQFRNRFLIRDEDLCVVTADNVGTHHIFTIF